MEIRLNWKQLFKQNWILLIILILTIVSYFPVFNAGFVNLDDNGYVYENPDIISGGFGTIAHFFTRFYVGHYMPLTMLDLKTDYLVFGLNAPGFHIMNLLLHLLNCWLVFVLIYKIFRSNQIAVIVTALFALHPMHVESVAWISERKDLLYTFFLLLSAILYYNYISGLSNRKFLYLSVIAFIFSLLSKSAAVIFPFLLILIDLISKRKLSRNVVIEKIPYFVLSVIFAILTLYSQDVGGKGSEVFSGFSGADKLMFACFAFGFYILKMFVPSGMSAYHPFPDIQNGNLPDDFYLSIIITVLFIGLLVWLIFRSVKTKTFSVYLFGMLFYVIAISLYLYLPVGRVVVAERFSYLSYIGLFLILAAFINRLLTINESQLMKNIILIMFVLLILFLAFLTTNRAAIWKNGISLWENVLMNYPTDPVANKSMADAYTGYKNYDRAIEYYKKAVSLNPSYTEAYYNMGNMNLKNKNPYQAIIDYTKALDLNPKLTDGYVNRGNAKAQLNDLQGAIADYSSAIINNPDKTEAYVNRGSSWYLLKNQDSACIDWQKASLLGSEQAKEMVLNYCR